MIVQARFNSSDLVGKLRDGEYELPEGATVAALMEEASREAGLELTEQQRNNYVFVYDNSPAFYTTELRDGNKLRVMLKVLGG